MNDHKEVDTFIRKHWKRNTIRMMENLCEQKYTGTLLRTRCKAMGIDPISSRDLLATYIIVNHRKETLEQMAAATGKDIDIVKEICEKFELTPYVVPVNKSVVEKIKELSADRAKSQRRTPHKAVYNQSHSPFGLADELRGITLAG